MATPATATPPKATTTRKTFSRSTTVSIEIAADPAIIWQLLTNAADFARWNSTVISIEGTIAPGQTIQLKAKLDPARTFKLKVIDFEPNKTLAWGDAMGKRVFTIVPGKTNVVRFTMSETIGGPLFPLFAKMIPPFDQPFEQFAADLKQEAESIHHLK